MDDNKEYIPIPKQISVYAPDYFTTKLMYFKSDEINTNSSSTIKSNLLKLNCAYRPDGTAHDANGYDIWSNIYKQNRVIGATVNMVWRCQDKGGGAANYPDIRCGYEILGNLGDAATTFNKMMEKKHRKHVGDITTCFGINVVAGTIIQLSNKPYQCSANYVYNPNKVPDNIVDYENDPTTWNAVNSSPITPHYLNMWIVESYGIAKSCILEMEVVYTVQWRELRYDTGLLLMDVE